jgi:hypothetical protein
MGIYRRLKVAEMRIRILGEELQRVKEELETLTRERETRRAPSLQPLYQQLHVHVTSSIADNQHIQDGNGPGRRGSADDPGSGE